MEHLLLSVSEAASVTGLGRSKLLSLVYAGDIPSITVGRRRLIPAASLRAWVEIRLQEAQEQRS